MANQHQKIAAVIVTYNRKQLLTECIQALLKQTRKVDIIIVIDNASTDGTKDLLVDLGMLNNDVVDYIRLKENIGGSGGFYEGIKHGYEMGCDWVWVMDDDAEPEIDTLETLLNTAVTSFNYQETPVTLCPVIKNIYSNEIQNYHHKRISEFFIDIPAELPLNNHSNLVQIDGNAFVGPIFNRLGIEKLGLPMRDYFIWVDDLEYTYRFSQQGSCFLVTNAVILHKDKPGFMAPWKIWYGQRNYLNFITKRVFIYCKNRHLLTLRIGIGVLYQLFVSIKYSLRYLKLLGSKEKFVMEEMLLPINGFLKGLSGGLGKRE